MRMSHLFSTTLREAPADAEGLGYQYLLRAGYVRQHAAGIFSLLPLGRRVVRRIEAVMREEIEAIGGQEVSMPVVNPAELWQESGRWYRIDAEMGRFQDRSGREMVLAMTHEEATADLVRKVVRSYRQLPMLVFHFKTKWRDDPRPRGGLIRLREFLMKDSYTLDADWAGLERQYEAHIQAYHNIFSRCGLPVISVAADTGMMGGKLSHEFMYLNPIGEDTLLLCDACGYAANRQVAQVGQDRAAAAEDMRPVEKVATPDCKTIAELARFLGIAESQTAKAVFLMASLPPAGNGAAPASLGGREQFVFAVVRGDMELNETKLAHAVGARALRPATEDEIRAVGASPGYASPVGLKDVLVVVDERVTAARNLAAGANEEGYHLLNVNYGRDYEAQIVTDLAAARAGDPCPECGSPLRAERGVEVGNIFQLGTEFSAKMGCTYTDANGEEQPVIMGSYGIGLDRLMACLAEEHHDEHGLVWPDSVAPYPVHLVRLAGRGGTGESVQAAERLYEALRAAGLEPLYDDRDESPGVKFNDADLIGVPVRLTVSERALQQGGVEMKRRASPDKVIVPIEDVVARVKDICP